ncbi:MAG TPA: hypothetical protein VFN95_02945 [Flavitalea sp.]|nr:hypothetical protein [Flavitalea sp.]
MKTIFICVSLLIFSTVYSQKEISQQALNELVNKASLFLGLENNDKVKSALNRYVATYKKAGASTAMANLAKDLEGRKDLLMFMNRATQDRESLFETLTAMNISTKSAQELADYFFPKNGPPRIPVRDTGAAHADSVKAPEPFVKKPPSKKFFDGRKTFCDSSGTLFYRVVIIKDNVLLTKYRGKPKDDLSIAMSKGKALLNGEDIVSDETHLINFRYENNIFYEKDESERWIKYVECPDE